MKGAEYVHAVQDRYLALRGGGLTLSPVDADVIRAWRDHGVPLELALLGLQRAHGARQLAGRGVRERPFRLRHAEPYVLELFEAYARRSGGIAAHGEHDPADAGRIGAALSALAGEHGGARAAAYTSAIAALPRGLLDADEAMSLGYLAALPRAEQRRIALGARRAAGPRSGVPRPAYRATLRALLVEAARADGGLRRPSDLA